MVHVIVWHYCILSQEIRLTMDMNASMRQDGTESESWFQVSLLKYLKTFTKICRIRIYHNCP